MAKINISAESLQAIFFDFDGVLAECMEVKTEAFAQLYAPYGEDVVKKVVKHHTENGGISRYIKIKHYHENYLNNQISGEQIEEIAQRFSDLVVEKVIKSDWVKGAKELLEKYYKKIDFYVISGTPEGELKKIVKEKNMNKYFKEIYGSPITKPEHARKIISKMNYDPEKVLYVGDSLSDYKNAMEAEIPFLGRLLPGEKSVFPDGVPTINDFLEVIN